MSGTDIAYAATRSRRADPPPQVKSAIRLRASYAMSGTDIACSICLRAAYAMSGTDIAYGATSWPIAPPCLLRWR
eukprot:3516563-Rhodomonas_salina.4